MTYQERKSEAFRLVSDFLSDLSPPRGVDEDKLSGIIERIADAFARKMPTKGDYAEKVRAVLTKLRDSHMSNTWPTQAAFVSYMPDLEFTGPKAAETFKPDDFGQLMAERMAEGDAVPEPAVWGIASNSVGGRLLEQYRVASVSRWRAVYGDQAKGLMVSRYGDQVSLYFGGTA